MGAIYLNRMALGLITPPPVLDSLAVMSGVARVLRQRLNFTPRRLGIVKVMSRSRVLGFANPDASEGAMARGGGAEWGLKAK